MNNNFQFHHGAMLLKYSGISFISGAVNHGFFSGERSLWTATLGVLLFVLGATMEHRLSDASDEPQANLLHTLVWGALLSIGLGFFTGGLQHFPDSPARSSWVVPLGFLISVLAMALNGAFKWQRTSTFYALIGGLLVSLGSYGTWHWLEDHPEYLGTHAHTSNAAGENAHHESLTGITSMIVTRSVEIRMNDTMRFTPDNLQILAGETIRFTVRNEGKIPHELVLGTNSEIREHAEAMKKAASDHHAHASGISIELQPGESGDESTRN
jgi:plastocyanin